MAEQKEWKLRGEIIECCRQEGHCPLAFGREIWGPEGCISFQTYQVEEGQIQDVDMKGLTIIYLITGIGPIRNVTVNQREVAIYVSDNASDAQRKVLDQFLPTNMRGQGSRKCYGIKYVKIDIKKKDGIYNVTMPFGEQELALTVGADGTPMRAENLTAGLNTWISNLKFCNTHFWKYYDYGMTFEYRGTGGMVADFSFQGVWPSSS